MSQKSILVANATGKQGGGVVRHCLAKGFRVVALVRDPTSSKAKNLASLGAELVQGHFDDKSSLVAAMDKDKNIDTVFFHEVQTGDRPADLKRVQNMVEAIQASPHITLVITTTASKTGQHESFPGWGPSYPMYGYWIQKHAIEELVRGAGFPRLTIVRPSHFLQNTLPPVSAMLYPGFSKKDLTLRVAYNRDTKIPLVDCSDVGVVAAEAMASPDSFSGREIELAAEALTIEEFAGKIGRVLEAEVKVHYYSDEEIAAFGGRNPAVATNLFANDVPGEDAAEAAKEFPLTPVSSFLEANKDILGS